MTTEMTRAEAIEIVSQLSREVGISPDERAALRIALADMRAAEERERDTKERRDA